jgi:hypothetical protein
MTCDFWLFLEAGDEDDLESLRNLLKRYARRCFRLEAFRAVVRRGIRYAMERAWAYYRDSAAPADAYWRAVAFFWDLVNWPSLPCRILEELVTYVAEAAAKYKWPARWPFLVMAAVAAEENGCRIPSAVAKALGPEHEALRSFLEQGKGVVEVAGRKKAVVRKKLHLAIEDCCDVEENSKF